MRKKKDLTAALAEPPPAPPAAQRPPDRRAAPARRSDRAGKTNITGYFDMPVKWELQDLANEQSRRRGRKVNLQDLLTEALNDLFKKYGKTEIAPTGEPES